MNSVWDIHEDQFPQSGSMQDKIRFWLKYAILAPSAHNTQPWQFKIHDDHVAVYRDEAHTLQRGDPTLRETFLSLGACIENFCLAANHWGHHTEVKDQAQDIHQHHVADIMVSSEPSSPPSDDIFPGIQKRHTNRGEYEAAPVDDSVMTKLKIRTEPETELFFITDHDSRQRIAQLVGKGTHIALAMPVMQRELAELVSRVEEQRDTGMVVEALTETPPTGESGSDWVLHTLDPLEQARTWETTFASTPLHAIVATTYDGPEAWLAAGQDMERLLVTAADLGLSHCIAAAPIEIPTLTPELRKEIPAEYRPQLLVRLGIAKNTAYSVATGRRNSE